MSVTLKAARVNKNLTLEKASSVLGINKDTLSRWERSLSYPNALQIRKIETLYEVNYSDLIF